MSWIPVTDTTLPPLEEPVWLYLPDVGQPIVGVRVVDDGAWYWAHCYGDFYWGNAGWRTDTAELDDLKPSHWMLLPRPPVEA